MILSGMMESMLCYMDYGYDRAGEDSKEAEERAQDSHAGEGEIRDQRAYGDAAGVAPRAQHGEEKALALQRRQDAWVASEAHAIVQLQLLTAAGGRHHR